MQDKFRKLSPLAPVPERLRCNIPSLHISVAKEFLVTCLIEYVVLVDYRLHCFTGTFAMFYDGSDIGIGVDSMETKRQEQV